VSVATNSASDISTRACRPEDIRITQQVPRGPNVFAEIEVALAERHPNFVEIDTGYSCERIPKACDGSTGKPSPVTEGVSRILDVWYEHHLLRLLGEHFGVALDTCRRTTFF